MGESPRLARAPVNGHTDIDDIFDLAEQVVEVAVGHVKGHVADEEGAARGVVWAVWAGDGAGGALDGVLDTEAAAFEVLEVVFLDGGGGPFGVGEFDVAVPVGEG